MASKKEQVALSSVFASLFLTVIKLISGILSGSIGILSEAAHSALDLGAAILTYFAVHIGDQPADREHPYGHGKVENVSALIETGLLFLTSVWIVYEAIHRLLLQNTEIKVAWYSLGVIVISILVDFSRSRALNQVAKQTKSQALEADALHFSSDILSSLVVLFGLLFTALGMRKADAIAALGVSVFVLKAGYNLGKRTIGVLVDTMPEGLSEKIIKVVGKVQGVIAIKKIRVRSVGARVFVEMTINISRGLTLEKTQAVQKKIEKEIYKLISETEITIEVKPLSLDNETISERVRIVANNHNLSVHDVIVHTQGLKKYVSFDLEVTENLTIKQAHEESSALEEAIKNEVGHDVNIITHIEPSTSNIIFGTNIVDQEGEKLRKIIRETALKIESIRDIHNIQICRMQDNYFVAIHCVFDNHAKLGKVHDLSSYLEYLLRQKMPAIKKVVVHAEPFSK